MMLGIYFLVALVLGGLPARLLWGRGILMVDGAQLRARLSMGNPGDHRRRRRWWKSAAIWGDPLRGAAMGWLLMPGLMAQAEQLERGQFLALKFAGFLLMLGGVWWQSSGRGKDALTPAPLLFLGGLMAGAFGAVVGLSALAIALMALFASQSVAVALFAMAATTACAGWLLIGPSATLLLATLLALVPWIKAFVLRQKLVVALRG
jgi:hypothetical protein